MWNALNLTWLFLLCQSVHSIAQSSQSGRVVDEQGEGIVNTNILLKVEKTIVAFTSTDHDGSFVLNYPRNLNSQKAILEINHISYVQKQLPLVAGKDLLITLQHKENVLEEVRIGKPQAIRQNQDTITYQVNSFSDSSDRSIGEVLRKMPGFHVADDGKISYNGQSISHLYLDGDDLLGNRYGIGAKTIPHDVVATVEVYKNHQAIRALKDKFNSNDVAVNLTIKENSKTEMIGEIKAGIGLPHQFQTHISNIYLKKKLKMLNDVLWTSLDEDVETAVRDLVTDKATDPVVPLLRTGMTNVLDEPAGNFRKNRSVGISSNLLLKAKSNWNIRLNAGAYIDRKFMHTSALQKYLLIDSTVTNAENTDIVFKPVQLDFSVNLTKNINELYLGNELAVSFKNHRTTDRLTSGSFEIHEQLRQQSYHVANRSYFIPKSKNKNIWNFKWFNSFSNVPEKQRYLSDSILTVLSMFGHFYHAEQEVKNKEFLSQFTADLTAPEWHGLYHTYGIEGDVKLSEFESNLFSANNNQEHILNMSNQSRWKELKANFYAQLQWNRRAIRFNLRVPLGGQHIDVRDQIMKKTDKRPYFLFTPSVSLRYLLSTKQQIKFLFAREQQFGKIDDVYANVIMSDFRTLSQGLTIIPYTEKQNYQIGYSLEFVEKMLFLNLQYNHIRSKMNLIHKLEIEENNTRSVFTKEDNLVTTNELKLTVSKFLDFLNGTSSVQISRNTNQSVRVINSTLMPFRVINTNIVPSVQGKIGTFLNWNYMGTLSWMDGRNATGFTTDEETLLQRHSGQLTLNITNGIYWSVQANRFKLENSTSKANLNFVNTSIRLVTKTPFSMEYELAINNILNQRENNSLFVAPNMTFDRSYKLRGRTVLVSALLPLSNFKSR